MKAKRKRRKKKPKNQNLMLEKREQKKKRNLERIQNLRLMDDLLMTRVFDDRAYVIFVNGSYRRDSSETQELSDLEKLIIDFNRSDINHFYHKVLGDRVAFIKNL